MARDNGPEGGGGGGEVRGEDWIREQPIEGDKEKALMLIGALLRASALSDAARRIEFARRVIELALSKTRERESRLRLIAAAMAVIRGDPEGVIRAASTPRATDLLDYVLPPPELMEMIASASISARMNRAMIRSLYTTIRSLNRLSSGKRTRKLKGKLSGK